MAHVPRSLQTRVVKVYYARHVVAPRRLIVQLHPIAKLNCDEKHIEMIESAIDQFDESKRAQILYCRYNGGANPGTVRAIYPVRWRSRPISFDCWDQSTIGGKDDAKLKWYKVESILELTTKPFN